MYILIVYYDNRERIWQEVFEDEPLEDLSAYAELEESRNKDFVWATLCKAEILKEFKRKGD